MKLYLLLASALISFSAFGGIVERGIIEIQPGETNATAIVSIGDLGHAYALDRVFLGTRASDYTGTVEVAAVDWGYLTVIASGSGITHAAPFESRPARSVVSTAYALDTNGVVTASTVSTNMAPYLVKDLQLYVTVNATNTTARRVFWAIYAD